MANFSKVLGLASTALVFAGMAFGQNCTGGTALQTPLVRAEGATELVGEYQFTCAVGATINILDIVSQPVTSKVLSTSGATSGQTEAVAVVSSGAVYNGTVSGSQITFNGVVVPAGGTVTIANVRVNASSLVVGTGTPPAVTESAFISGNGVQASVTAAQPVAYALAGLGAQTAYQTIGTGGTKGVNTFLVCATYNAKAGSNNPLIAAINVKENFATAFKGQGTQAGNAALGSEFANNTETGVATAVGATNNTAAAPTIIQVSLANVATGVSIFMPVAIGDLNAVGSTLTLVTSPSNLTALTASTSTSAVAGTAAIAVSNNAATAYYAFTPAAGNASNGAIDSFSIPIYGNASANTVLPTSSALTATVSFSPTTNSQIPSFVVNSSTTAITLNNFLACTTSLLFPFVTDQVNFDTGLAISNTSTDPFAANAKGGAVPQNGTCTLNYYGPTAPTPATFTTPNIPTATTWVGMLSSLAPGFQGYIIAQCSFQFAHGFAFLTSQAGNSAGVAMGYLAGVLPDTNQVQRATGAFGEGLGN